MLTATINGQAGGLSVARSLAGRPRLHENTTPAGFSPSVQFLASGSVPGVLEPGESVTVPVYEGGWLQSQWTSTRADHLYRRRARSDQYDDHRLELARGEHAPEHINKTAWNAIFPILTANLGFDLGPVPPDARQRRRLPRRASASRPPI